MSTTSNATRINITRKPIEVSRVYKADFQKEGSLTAELKQEVTTRSYYPSKQTHSSLSSNPFSQEEFGYAEQEYTQTRIDVAWIDVPEKETVESVVAKLEATPGAKLYRILSNKPILSSQQQYAVDTGLNGVTLDTFAHRQVVRYSEEHPTNPGEIILDNYGKPIYKAVFFTTEKEDQDLRTSDPEDFYISESMRMELEEVNNVVDEQSIF